MSKKSNNISLKENKKSNNFDVFEVDKNANLKLVKKKIFNNSYTDSLPASDFHFIDSSDENLVRFDSINPGNSEKLKEIIEKKWELPNITGNQISADIEKIEKDMDKDLNSLVSETNSYFNSASFKSSRDEGQYTIENSVKKNNPNLLTLNKKKHFEKYFEKYFSDIDYCFLNIKRVSKNINVKLLEKINQKILIELNEKNIFFSEKTFIYLCLYYLYTGRNYEGIRLIESYSNLFKHIPIFYHLLGNFYFKLKDKKNALKYFKLSIDEIKSSKFPLIKKIYSTYLALSYIYVSSKEYHLSFHTLKMCKVVFKKNPIWIKLYAETLEKNNFKEKAFLYYKFLFDKYINKCNKVSRYENIIKKILVLSFSLRKTSSFLDYLTIAKENNIQLDHIHYMEILIQILNRNEEQAYKTLQSLSFPNNQNTVKLKSSFFAFMTSILEENQSHILSLIKYILINLSNQICFTETFIILENYCNQFKYSFSLFLEEEIDIHNIDNFDILVQIAYYGKKYNHKNLAYSFIKKALEINPDSQIAKILLTKLEYIYNPDEKVIYPLLMDLEKSNEIDEEIYFYLGEYYHKSENYIKSIDCLKKSLKNGYSNLIEIFFLLGKNYIKLEKYNKALVFLKKALKINSDRLDLKFHLGIVYKKQNLLKKALSLFKIIIKQDPDNKEAHFNLSEIYKLILKSESEKHYSIYLE